MHRKINIGTTTLPLMVFLTCVAQVIVLIRSSLLASRFGASFEMDAFSLSNSVVSFVFGILASGVPTIIIPHYVKNTKLKSINTFVSYIYFFLLILFSGILIFRFPIIHLLSGKGKDFTVLSGNLLLILIVGQFAASVTNVTIAFFQSNNRYNLPRITALFSNSLLVVFLLINKDTTIVEYTIALTISLVLNFLIDIVFAYIEGWGFLPSINFDENVRIMLKSFGPIVFSSGIYQISLFIDSTIVSRLETGQLTILSFSLQITNIVYTIIVSNLLSFSFPKIVKNIKNNDSQSEFWRITNICHFFECLVLAGFLAVGKEGVGFFLGHGQFTKNSVSIVYNGTCIYIFGQQISIIREFIYRYFYSLSNTKVAAVNSTIISISNITISLILVNLIGYYGIIIGTVSAALISLLISFIQFKRLIGFDKPIFQILRSLISNIMVSFVTVIVVIVIKKIIVISSVIISIFVFGIITILVFFILERILYPDIVKDIKIVLRRG